MPSANVLPLNPHRLHRLPLVRTRNGVHRNRNLPTFLAALEHFGSWTLLFYISYCFHDKWSSESHRSEHSVGPCFTWRAPLCPLVTLRLTCRHLELWVAPFVKVCRCVDLVKVTTKGWRWALDRLTMWRWDSPKHWQSSRERASVVIESVRGGGTGIRSIAKNM